MFTLATRAVGTVDSLENSRRGVAGAGYGCPELVG